MSLGYIPIILSRGDAQKAKTRGAAPSAPSWDSRRQNRYDFSMKP